MKHSESITKIAPALLAAQKKLHNIKQTAENPFYDSTYAPINEILAEIRPIYNGEGITILQDVSPAGCISTMLLHESGEWIQQEGMLLPLDKQTPQGAGSAMTYGRRYTLTAITGLATDEDDDGNKAEGKQKQKSVINNETDYFLDNDNKPTKECYQSWKASGIQGTFGKWVKNNSTGTWDWYSVKHKEETK